MRELGMFSVASFIVGLPGETIIARERALDAALQAGPDTAQFLPFFPFPGVPMAAGRNDAEPDPEASAAASRFTREFYRSEQTRRRLHQAAASGGIRALLAQGTLEKYADVQP